MRHLMVPTNPTARLTLIHAHFAFAFMPALFLDVLYKRLFVNPKRQHVQSQVTWHSMQRAPIAFQRCTNFCGGDKSCPRT
jgi:hypothetical protein